MFNQAPYPSPDQQQRARQGQSNAAAGIGGNAGQPNQRQMGGSDDGGEAVPAGIGGSAMGPFGMHHAMSHFGPDGSRVRLAIAHMAMGGAPGGMPGHPGRMLMRGQDFAPQIRNMGRPRLTRAFGAPMPIKEPGMADGGDAFGAFSPSEQYQAGIGRPFFGNGSGELGPQVPTGLDSAPGGPGGFFIGPNGARVPNDFGGHDAAPPQYQGGIGFGGDAMGSFGPTDNPDVMSLMRQMREGQRQPGAPGQPDWMSRPDGAESGGMSGLMGDYAGGSPRNPGDDEAPGWTGQPPNEGGWGGGWGGDDGYSSYGGIGGYQGGGQGFDRFNPYPGDFYQYGQGPGWSFFGDGTGQGGGGDPAQRGIGGGGVDYANYGQTSYGGDNTGAGTDRESGGLHSSYDQYSGPTMDWGGVAKGAAKGLMGGPLGMLAGAAFGGLGWGSQADMDPGSYGPMSGPHGNPEVGGAAHGDESGPGNQGGNSEGTDTDGGGSADANARGGTPGGIGARPLDKAPVKGPGTGRSDSIPAQLSDGEHVIPADVVAGLGDGSSDAGHRILNAMIVAKRKKYRQHLGKLPPPKE